MTAGKFGRRTALKAAVATALAGTGQAARGRDNVLRYALAVTQPQSFDPAINVQGEDQNVTRQVFDTLIDPPYGTFDLAPEHIITEAAESWDISKDSKTYSVTLRQGMLFHKGYGEVTADDAKFTYDRLRDPATGSPYLIYYTNIDEVTVLDKYRLQIRLKEPDPTFYATAMIARAALILPRKAVEKLGAQAFRRSPIGSGPFEYEAYDPNRGVILKRFEQYHLGPAPLDGIEFRYVPDPTARTLGFLKGELDVIEGVRLPGWVDDTSKQAPHAIFDYTRPGSLNTVFFNMTRKPFDDIRVRLAIRYAIDRNVFKQAFGDMYGDVWGINPPEYPGGFKRDEVPEELRYDYNPAKSKQLLADAGYPHGFGFDNIISQREDYQSIMLMMQDMLRAVGVEMRLNTIDHTTYHTDCLKDMCPFVLNSETNAPVGTVVLQGQFAKAAVVGTPTGRANYSHYGQVMPGIDDILAKIVQEPDLNKRIALTREAELKILHDMPAWVALTLRWVLMRNPKLDLGYQLKESYAYFTLYKARFTA